AKQAAILLRDRRPGNQPGESLEACAITACQHEGPLIGGDRVHTPSANPALQSYVRTNKLTQVAYPATIPLPACTTRAQSTLDSQSRKARFSIDANTSQRSGERNPMLSVAPACRFHTRLRGVPGRPCGGHWHR